MRADADEAARRLAAAGIVAPVAAFLQGLARVLCGDAEAGEVFFGDAISIGDVAAPDVLAVALCERSLLAMRRGDWARAEDLAGQARTVMHQARIEDSYATPLIGAVQARAACHRGDVAAARQQLVSAQRSRPLLTYALPQLAVQARIELTGVHLALGDIAGARTLMREIDELLKRRPGLGTLDREARALRARLSADRRSASPGASSLTTAELRLLPLLVTHLSFPEIAAHLFLSLSTIKSQAMSLYRKLEVTSRSQAVARAQELGLLEGHRLREVDLNGQREGRGRGARGQDERAGFGGPALVGPVLEGALGDKNADRDRLAGVRVDRGEAGQPFGRALDRRVRPGGVDLDDLAAAA
jgi:LuxR family maltose regulon positive regulatory protein